jgi:hypothetical protein
VRFNLKAGGAFNEDEVKKALDGQGFPEMTVKAVPGKS